ncbi:ScbR family autoregulator-binding transcription factor [Streptomyces sp. SM12]|uniref:ScbR family autoregulator-binding transcription factor n=1 Tax=Streptomyces sp. SM12 TaxID=1071602 RepID=UPI0015E19368|nr:ScbR family autoregulator-binding transcription factor [Streptomyces sp. SM12]
MARQRQERAERTRAALITAAAELFDQGGYHGVGLNAILQRAGLTTGAMYFHFKSKEELARAVIVNQADELQWTREKQGLQQLIDVCQYLAAQMRSDVLFRAGVRLAVEQNEANLLDYSIYDWWAQQFHVHLVEARELGQLRPEVNEAAFAQVMVASFTGTQIMSRLADSWSGLPERIEAMLRCLLPALAPPGVLATLELSGKPLDEEPRADTAGESGGAGPDPGEDAGRTPSEDAGHTPGGDTDGDGAGR